MSESTKVEQHLATLIEEIQSVKTLTESEAKERKEKLLPDLKSAITDVEKLRGELAETKEELVNLKKISSFQKNTEIVIDSDERKKLQKFTLAQIVLNAKNSKAGKAFENFCDTEEGKAFAQTSKALSHDINFVDFGQKTALDNAASFAPSITAAELFDNIFTDSLVASSMRQITMTTGTMPLVDITTQPVVYSPAQNAIIPDGTPAFGSENLVAKPVAARSLISYAAVEDSILPIVSDLQTLLGRGIRRGIESMFLNGDDAAAHMDTDKSYGTTAPERQTDGLRLKGLASYTSLGSGGLAWSDLITLLKVMGAKGIEPSDVAMAVSLNAYYDILSLNEFKSINVYGPDATAVTGVIRTPLGAELIPSDQLYSVVLSTGARTTSGTFAGEPIIAYSKSLNVSGNRKGIEFKIKDESDYLQWQVIANSRKGYASLYSGTSGQESVAYGAYSA